MSTGSPRGIVVKVGVVWEDGECYKKGPSRGLIRLDMGIEVPELRKILAAFSSAYAGLFRYGTVKRHTAGEVAIDLVLDQGSYRAVLKKGPKREDAWIAASPVMDGRSRDIRVAGFALEAGLQVQSWTAMAVAGRLPPRYPPLQFVRFVVDGTTWTFLGGVGVSGPRVPQ